MTVLGVGSRFRGNDDAPGDLWRRCCAPSVALTRRMDSCLRGNDGARCRSDRSTFSRRVRGVLSPYRERGNSALSRLNGGEIPAYAGMTVMGVGGEGRGHGDGGDGAAPRPGGEGRYRDL